MSDLKIAPLSKDKKKYEKDQAVPIANHKHDMTKCNMQKRAAYFLDIFNT